MGISKTLALTTTVEVLATSRPIFSLSLRTSVSKGVGEVSRHTALLTLAHQNCKLEASQKAKHPDSARGQQGYDAHLGRVELRDNLHDSWTMSKSMTHYALLMRDE